MQLGSTQMPTFNNADDQRRAASFARRNVRNPYEVWLETLERARDALRRGELPLVEREIEYVIEKLEKIAP